MHPVRSPLTAILIGMTIAVATALAVGNARAEDKPAEKTPAAKSAATQDQALALAKSADLPALAAADRVVIAGADGGQVTLDGQKAIQSLRAALTLRPAPPSAGETAATLSFYRGEELLREVWVYDGGEWGFNRPGTNWTCGVSQPLWRFVQKRLAEKPGEKVPAANDPAQKPTQKDPGGDAFGGVDLKKLGIEPFKSKKDPATGFIVGGKNDTKLIAGLTHIAGRTIAELEADMRPGAKSEVSSTDGFLGADEKLLEILAADNDLVLNDLGLTHQELALHLNVAAALAQRQVRADAGARNAAVEFTYRGIRFKMLLERSRGFQLSPFKDGTKTNTYGVLTNLETKKELQYSLLLPPMIERYGFYEGKGTPYRVEPRDIADIFGLTQEKSP